MTFHLYPAERALRRVLTVFVVGFLIAAVLYQLAPIVGPFRTFARQLPFVSNSVVKVSILMLCCLFAAGDIRKRMGLVLILVLAHAASFVAMGILLLFADTSALAQVGSATVKVATILWGAMGLDGVILVLLLAFYLSARGQVAQGPELVPPAAAPALSRRESWFRGLMIVLAVLFGVAAVAYEAGPFVPAFRALFVEFPFVTNSVVKVSALAMLCVYVATDLRRNMSVAGIVIAAHVVSLIAMAVYLAFLPGQTAVRVPVGTGSWPMSSVLVGAMVLDGIVAGVVLGFYQAAWRGRFAVVADWGPSAASPDRGPVFLRPLEFRALVALADVVVAGRDERLPPEDVAANVDRYVRPIRVKRRWTYRASLVAIQLHPLLYLKAPFSELDAASRSEHLKVHFQRRVVLRLIPDWWRRIVQIVIRVGKQLTYVGYYNDPRTFDSVGYTPFSARGGPVPPKHDVRLDVEDPAEVPDVIQAEVCVIGSGAAGAILAYDLAARGKTVLVVERGGYVNPRDFTEDEIEMMGRLYAEGVFQQTEDFRFTILQGSCVGGSTVVNNAVCFDPPRAVLERWNRDHAAALDVSGIERATQEIRSLISIQQQPRQILNPSAERFIIEAEKRTTGADALETGIVEANIRDCLGCGYCNVGCAYGRKLSMLDTVLPKAQQDYPGRVRILPQCEVALLRVVSGRPPRVLDARGRLKLAGRERKVTIRADTFVVAAGAVASPHLLLESGIGRRLPVGRSMSFNMGAPITAEFADEMDAYRGLQISHYGIPRQDRGFVFETWWNPPVAQAVNMPGWFEDHFDNMRRYRNLMAVGVLAGTEANARVIRALTGGPGVVYTPESGDLRKLADGLAQVAEILFDAGALRLMFNTWGHDVLTHPNQIGDVYRIAADPSYLTLGTGHPQGGNAISTDPLKGVVDENFRVHGYDNLYVCDASVFPTSVTVNPQLTVMALARYASARIGT